MSQLLNSAQNSLEFNKLYIGQLPLSVSQPFIRDVLSKYTEVKDVRIIKGDSRGNFDRFCYSFAMVRGDEEICKQIIKKVNEQFPEWKLNIKVDNDRFKYMQNQPQGQPRQGAYNQPPQNRPPYGDRHSQERNIQSHQPYYEKQPPGYGGYYQPGMNMPPPFGQFPPHNMSGQPQQYRPPQQHFYPPKHEPSQQFGNINQPEKVVGQKQNRIMVRQIWLGGIPQLCDKMYMHQLMSQFGIIQNLEIFPKFAFIKFKLAQQATAAFERAERIYNMFGRPPGFRIFFSDPIRRANVVGNHYQYDRQSPFLPVLFLGFPPVTSATIEMDHMKNICQKYGPITNAYMKKNSNNQTRSFFLFTYEDVKYAFRAKAELNKRRDLLGDKRVEVTLLLDEDAVIRNRDLSYTEKTFQNEQGPVDKKKPIDKGFVGDYGNYPKQGQKMSPPPMHYGMYGQRPPNYEGYGMPPVQNFPPGQNYYQPYFDPNSNQERGHEEGGDVHDFLQSVLEVKTENQSRQQRPLGHDQLEKKPMKSQYQNDNQESVTDIVSKMLGQTQEKEKNDNEDQQKERQPSWSGFLTWKGLKRVGVDGHTEFKEPQDYVINIMNLIDPKDIVVKEKATMILQPTNSMSQPAFKQYVRALKVKVGVSFTPHSLIYVMGKCKQADEIKVIKENELLVVMQKNSLTSLIRDKLQKCEELK